MMQINSKGVAILLAISIAVVTTAFLSLVKGVSVTALSVAFILAFSSGYILINVTLEFLIFKEINRIYDVLDALRDQDFDSINKAKNKTFSNPIKKINQEIYSYAALKQKEIDELKRLEVFRREFLADISHELKTPIFAAQGFVHTLIDGAVKDKNVRNKFLKKAAKSLDGLDILVQDLLTISQMETGQIKMDPQLFDIHELIGDVFDQFEGKAEKKSVSLKFRNDPGEKQPVYADRRRIFQVLLNLTSNALKYTNKDTSVELWTERDEDDQVTIYIKDGGPGIPAEHIKRIFERFYRIEKSRSRDRGGTGLGLAIVKHIIEAHDSSIQVTSSVGKGSTFSFHLPGKVTDHPEVEELTLESVSS